MDKLEVITPIGDIPVGSVVTKIRGTKKYTVEQEVGLRVYPYGKATEKVTERQEQVFKTEGCRYLVPLAEEGETYVSDAINVVANTVNMVWHVKREVLIAFLTGEDYEDYED